MVKSNDTIGNRARDLPACSAVQQDALYRLIYYSKSAVHVSDDVLTHHQEHVTVFTVSGSFHPSRYRLPAGSNLGEHWRSWLRHCATSRKVAGSVPIGVMGCFLLK